MSLAHSFPSFMFDQSCSRTENRCCSVSSCVVESSLASSRSRFSLKKVCVRFTNCSSCKTPPDWQTAAPVRHLLIYKMQLLSDTIDAFTWRVGALAFRFHTFRRMPSKAYKLSAERPRGNTTRRLKASFNIAEELQDKKNYLFYRYSHVRKKNGAPSVCQVSWW